MTIDAHFFVGVDPCGGRKPFTYAVLDKNGKLTTLGEGEVEEVLAFVADLRGSLLVAVNSPPRPSMGLVRQENMRQNLAPLRISGRSLEMRLAEHQLRERGVNIAMTPSRKELCANWVQTGFLFYQGLEVQGFRQYPFDNAERQWIETHPHATFCTLLEQIPLPRPTLEGRLQRQLVLYEQGLGIHDPIDFFEEITRHKLLKGTLPMEQVYTPEQLDAISAACVVWMLYRRPERTCRVGDTQEGQVLLPVAEMKAKY